ncbi:D-lactate dehydrogenase [cytochrome], mitochondrial-like, partial [Rosa sericea]
AISKDSSANVLLIHSKGSKVFCAGADVKVVLASQWLPHELIIELKSVRKDNMTMDYEERYNHGEPQNIFYKAVNIPDLVVFP